MRGEPPLLWSTKYIYTETCVREACTGGKAEKVASHADVVGAKSCLSFSDLTCSFFCVCVCVLHNALDEPRKRKFGSRQVGGLLLQTFQSHGGWGSDPHQAANATLRPRLGQYLTGLCCFWLCFFSSSGASAGFRVLCGGGGPWTSRAGNSLGGHFLFFIVAEKRKKKEESSTGPLRVSCRVNGRVGSHPQPGGRRLCCGLEPRN